MRRSPRSLLPSIGLLLAPWLLLGANGNIVGDTVEGAEKLERFFSHCHEHGMFNGTVLIKEAGEVVYEKAWGVADPRTGRELTLDTPFYLASVSKQFTAMGAMILVERGELKLDDPLPKFLPEFAGFAGDVTVEHLMTNSSGIPDHYRLLGEVPDGLDNEMVRKVLLEHGELDFPPGDRFQYSNGGYVLLSLVIEKAAGRSLREHLADSIFTPLGMDRTQVYDTTKPEVPDRAVGFDALGRLADYAIHTTGAGGIFSTVRDLAKWDTALHEGRLVSAEMLERAFTPHRTNAGVPTGYGYGWMIQENGGRPMVQHAGGLVGFRTFIARDLDSKHTLIWLSNQGANVAAGAIGAAALTVLSGGEPELPRIPVGAVVRRWIESDGVERALARYDEVREAEPTRYDFGEPQLNLLGYEYLLGDEVDTAIEVFRKNIEVHPEAFNPYDSLGEAYLKKGNRTEAIRNYARSLVLNPENDNAIQMLIRLRRQEDR